MSESLMNHDGVLRGNNVIKLIPDQSVLKLNIGDRIRLSAARFERLSKAFLTEIQSKFLQVRRTPGARVGHLCRRGAVVLAGRAPTAAARRPQRASVKRQLTLSLVAQGRSENENRSTSVAPIPLAAPS
jgi:hypothetical protein